MNPNFIKNIIEQRFDLSEREKKLINEEQFFRNLTATVQNMRKKNEKSISDLIIQIVESLLKRYKKMVSLQVKEIKSNKKLFYQLFKQKIKDNCKTLDKNLAKFELRNQLRKKNSKNN